MSELDLPSLAERAIKENDLTLTTPMKQIDLALKACTFGRFHIKLLACAFVGFVTGVLVSNTTAFLLPSAECDLNMTLVQKGLLNAMPYIGMLLSSVVAGFLTDAFGRKIFLYTGFSGIFVVTLIAASSQSYEVLVTAKFFEGLLFATSFSPLVTLTSEFCHHGIRDQVMLCQSSFASISQIVVSGMAWGILTNDWKYTLFDGKFVLNTWNFYLYAMSLWSLAAWIMYGVLLPESPKYLLTQRKYDEAREILIKIYRENTGKPADTYPFYNLWREKTQEALDEAEEETSKGIAHQIVVGLHNIKPMFRKPLVGNLILICSVNFNLMSMYNVFRLWYPQISTIVENYDMTAGEDLCVVLDQYTSSLKAAALNTTTDAVCLPSRMGDETFINSMIIGCVCILPYFITGILVKKVGKKRLLIVASFVCIAGTIWIRWANSKVAVVALFAVNIALAQVMMSLNQTITVQVFPTTVRTLAISLMMVSGRIGTLTGNIGFPILLNMGCVTPFFTIAGIMVCVTVMSFFLPTK